MFRYRLTPILLTAFVLVVFVLPVSYGLITDWWWFREIGYQVVFTRGCPPGWCSSWRPAGDRRPALPESAGRAARADPDPVVVRLARTAPHSTSRRRCGV